MEHTPTEWIVKRKEIEMENQYRYKYWIEDENKVPVARLFHCGMDCIDHARLIAAAPDLLEACKDVNEWLRSNILATNRPASLDKILMDAISKAERKEV